MSNKVHTVNGVTYTKFYAWLPTRMRSGELVWLAPYYMRPDRNGQGVLLSFDEYLIDSNRMSYR
jgi:hypothetical protein